MIIHGQDSGAVPDHSTIEIHTKKVSCDGDGEHPLVYYQISNECIGGIQEGYAICEYCSIKYVYVGGGTRID